MSLGSFSLPYGRNHFHILFRSFRGPKGPAYGGERGTEEGMIGSERNWHAIPRVKRRYERQEQRATGVHPFSRRFATFIHSSLWSLVHILLTHPLRSSVLPLRGTEGGTEARREERMGAVGGGYETRAVR